MMLPPVSRMRVSPTGLLMDLLLRSRMSPAPRFRISISDGSTVCTIAKSQRFVVVAAVHVHTRLAIDVDDVDRVEPQGLVGLVGDTHRAEGMVERERAPPVAADRSAAADVVAGLEDDVAEAVVGDVADLDLVGRAEVSARVRVGDAVDGDVGRAGDMALCVDDQLGGRAAVDDDVRVPVDLASPS